MIVTCIGAAFPPFCSTGAPDLNACKVSPHSLSRTLLEIWAGEIWTVVRLQAMLAGTCCILEIASLQSSNRYRTFFLYMLTTPRSNCPESRSASGTSGFNIESAKRYSSFRKRQDANNDNSSADCRYDGTSQG